MPGEANDPTITIRRIINGTPAEVFALWTDPRLMIQWMTPYRGSVDCQAESDPRAGGAFRLTMTSGASQCVIEGTYVSVEPPHRLVFTWRGAPTRDTDTLVTVELRPAGHATELTLTHQRLPAPDLRQAHEAGWGTMLDHLTAVVR